MSDHKIIKIETLLAHHEQQIADLSEMIGAQWQEIERLRRRLDDALSKLEQGFADSAATARPPHW